MILPTPEFAINDQVIVTETEKVGTIDSIEIDIDSDGTKYPIFVLFPSCESCGHTKKSYLYKSDLEHL